MGFPSGGRTVIRFAVDPRGARSLRNVVAFICYRGTCKLATRLTSLGFVQASFTGPVPLGRRVPVQIVACSRLGCAYRITRVLVSQPGSG